MDLPQPPRPPNGHISDPGGGDESYPSGLPAQPFFLSTTAAIPHALPVGLSPVLVHGRPSVKPHTAAKVFQVSMAVVKGSPTQLHPHWESSPSHPNIVSATAWDALLVGVWGLAGAHIAVCRRFVNRRRQFWI